MTRVHHDTIKQQVADMRAKMAEQAPPALFKAFDAEQGALDAARVPLGVAGPGVPFPAADLVGADGQAVSSARLLDGTPTVVVFYRGAWCPYCNLTLRTYQQHLLPALRERGVNLVAISPQTRDGSLSMQQINELTYTVVSDPGSRIAAALGIMTAPTDDARAAQISMGLDLRDVNADGTVAIPMPTVAIVDSDAILRWIDVHPNYTTRTEPGEILDALHEIITAGTTG